MQYKSRRFKWYLKDFNKADWKRLRAALWVLFAAYAFAILYMTLLCRKPFEGKHLELKLFWSYNELPKELLQIIGNVVVFIPFGFLLGMLVKKRWIVLTVGGFYSALIELLQLLFKLGLCEFDDIVHNLLGTALGLLVLMLLRKRMRIDQ